MTSDGETFAFISGPAGSCRRCASDASQESVGNAGSIDVTTTDIPCELIPLSDVKVDPGKSKVKKLFGGIKKSP